MSRNGVAKMLLVAKGGNSIWGSRYPKISSLTKVWGGGHKKIQKPERVPIVLCTGKYERCGEGRSNDPNDKKLCSYLPAISSAILLAR